MVTNRYFIRRSLRGELTWEQEMELWLGPSHRGSLFTTREELQQAWLMNRDRVMAAHAKWGEKADGVVGVRGAVSAPPRPRALGIVRSRAARRRRA
jgi:hypothetical protein